MKQSSKKSAGLLLFRLRAGELQVLLAHMGGPFWMRKDAGAWTIIKGEFEGELPLDAARREFREETGLTPAGEFRPLTPIKQAGGKTVYAWALASDFDVTQLKSNSFQMEWPKGSGVMKEFPEIDRAEWFSLEEARRKILKSQLPLVDELRRLET